jgi:hypothetical protein
MDGLCDGGCGEPAVVEIQLGDESGFFCGLCAPTGAARPVRAYGMRARPCPACGHPLDFKGEDDRGEVWRCPACDTFGD